MFSQARVKNSVHVGVCMARGCAWQGGIHGRRCVWQEGGHVRQGSMCGGEGHLWQGVCMTGGLHGRGYAWMEAWMAGGMCDRREGLLLECILVGICVLAIWE